MCKAILKKTKNCNTYPDFNWLKNEAIELINKVHRIGDDGVHYWAPSTSRYSNGCWMRDFAYMLMYGPEEAFDWNQVKITLEQFMSLQSSGGAVPDRITINKKLSPTKVDIYATYAVVNSHPAEDNPSYLVMSVDRYSTVTGQENFFLDNIENIEKALNSVSRCPASGLVYIDPLEPHTGYGFCDLVDKQGLELFCSLLWWKAAMILSERLKSAFPKKSKIWSKEAKWLKDHLIRTFWDEKNNLLLAATGKNKQPDIWGSALAVTLNAVEDRYCNLISNSLIKNYNKIIRYGMARHTLSECWMHMFDGQRDYRYCCCGKTIPQVLPGRYQNGAFWATSTGWVCTAIARNDINLARKMVSDCINCLKENDNCECLEIHYDKNQYYARAIGYVASVVNPLLVENLFTD